MSKIQPSGEEGLSFERMYSELHKEFGRLEDHRRNNRSYSLQDLLEESVFVKFHAEEPVGGEESAGGLAHQQTLLGYPDALSTWPGRGP